MRSVYYPLFPSALGLCLSMENKTHTVKDSIKCTEIATGLPQFAAKSHRSIRQKLTLPLSGDAFWAFQRRREVRSIEAPETCPAPDLRWIMSEYGILCAWRKLSKGGGGKDCSPTYTGNEVISILPICRTDRMSKKALGQFHAVGGQWGDPSALLVLLWPHFSARQKSSLKVDGPSQEKPGGLMSLVSSQELHFPQVSWTSPARHKLCLSEFPWKLPAPGASHCNQNHSIFTSFIHCIAKNDFIWRVPQSKKKKILKTARF